jgi:hypothetical protein
VLSSGAEERRGERQVVDGKMGEGSRLGCEEESGTRERHWRVRAVDGGEVFVL